MAKQKIFKSSYISRLKRQLEEGRSVHLYKSKEFEYDREKELLLPTVNKPENLLDKMLEGLKKKDILKSAIALYEAYPHLTPLQASDERFWTYLTHVDLFSYMKEKRNKHITGKTNNEIKYIFKYWFLNSTSHSELMRHELAGLWWAVHLSVDNERENKYELTEVLFKNETLRTRTMGTYLFFRHKEAVIGILEFFRKNNFKEFEKTHQIFTKYINLIGGAKPLAYFDRHFFFDELSKFKEKTNVE